MRHEEYTINVSFTVCEGMKDIALEEIRVILEYLNSCKVLNHVSNLKTKVSHEEIQ